jgi:sirohydrochlorin ferrochelatase
MSRALLIVDHGSRRPEAHRHLEWIAEQVRLAAPGLSVYVAHMELAEPSIAQAVDACVEDGVSEIVVHPLFLVPGRHLSEDIPGLLEQAIRRHAELSFRLTEPVGSVPGIATLILSTLD